MTLEECYGIGHRFSSWFDYLHSNVGKVSNGEMSDVMGISVSVLKKFLSNSRGLGVEIGCSVYREVVGLGTIRVRVDRGREYRVIKTVGGWVRLRCIGLRGCRVDGGVVRVGGRRLGGAKVFSSSSATSTKPSTATSKPSVATTKATSNVRHIYIRELRMVVAYSGDMGDDEVRDKWLRRYGRV